MRLYVTPASPWVRRVRAAILELGIEDRFEFVQTKWSHKWATQAVEHRSDFLEATPVVRSVHVADTIAPVVTVLGPNPATVECATPFVDPGATAADSCVGSVAVTTSGAVNSGVPGSYTLGYTATDPSGNTGMASRLVNVNDTIPPTISVKGPFVLAPPNHKYKTFTVAELVSRVTDSCVPGLGIADAVITRVSSDEPEDGIGDGSTLNDIDVGADSRSTHQRVERSGAGNGRVYTITLHVQDLAGNRTEATVKVLVPTTTCTDDTAVDDGPQFTVPSTCP